jgi:hypothetical protein
MSFPVFRFHLIVDVKDSMEPIDLIDADWWTTRPQASSDQPSLGQFQRQHYLL